jgi:hypothetical protein
VCSSDLDWRLAGSESEHGLILKSIDFRASQDEVFEDLEPSEN